MSYLLFVADHGRYMEAPATPHARFEDLARAVAAAQAIVAASLRELHAPGISAEELYARYMSFGDDPYIIATGGGDVEFSAIEHARRRCAELRKCGAQAASRRGSSLT